MAKNKSNKRPSYRTRVEMVAKAGSPNVPYRKTSSAEDMKRKTSKRKKH